MSNKINEFLSGHNTCVLATVNQDGKPQAATIGFSHNAQYQFFIGTNEKSRKYPNLKANPAVALVVGTEGAITVQYEGQAHQVTGDELEERVAKHYEKVPAAKRFAGEAGQVYFLITPTWLRYSDLAHPEETATLTEFGDLA